MSKPLLHARVTDTLDLDVPPPQTMLGLRSIAPVNSEVRVDDKDSDFIVFEIDRDDILISGRIRRWQGTGSRLEFLAEVLVPEPSYSMRYSLIAVIVLAFIVGYWFFVMVPVNDYYSSVSEWSAIPPAAFLLMVVIAITIGVICYLQFGRNQKENNRRWLLQQEMAGMIEEIRQLEDHIADATSQRFKDLL